MNKKIYTAIIFFLFAFSLSVQTVSASAQDKLKGYAWSSNAGWISFNCFNTDSCDDVEYGVTSDASGNLSGYAWSDNLGWLNFSYYANATLDANTGIMAGDAQFIAADAVDDANPEGGDGWEGRVSLSGSSPSYGPVLNTSTFEIDGYAWGDVVTGWIDFKTAFASVTYDPFYFNFTANAGTEANKVLYNGSVILSWTTLGADSCTSLGGTSAWTSANPQPAGEPSTASQTITGLTADTTFSLRCRDSSNNTITRTLDILVNPPSPSVVIGASDTNIAVGGSTILNWTALHVASCTATGDWSGSKSVGSGQTETITGLNGTPTNPHNFDIECISLYPAVYANVTDNILVDVEKLEVTFSIDKDLVPYNDKVKLYYETKFATSCTATGTVPGWAGSTIDLSSGEHTFETTDPVTDEGISYSATLTCNGINSQQIIRTVQLKVRNNPNYQEV